MIYPSGSSLKWAAGSGSEVLMVGHAYPIFVCASPHRLLHRFHATQFPCNSLVKSSSSTFFSTLLPSYRQQLHCSVYRIMARIVIPSLTPHNINNSPWSVPVNLTFSRAEDFLLNFFSAFMYHLHTAILFTWTDYKTIFLPIVSLLIRYLPFLFPPSPLTLCFVDCLCLCNGTCTITLQPTPMLDMDLVSSTLMQCIQPSAQL